MSKIIYNLLMIFGVSAFLLMLTIPALAFDNSGPQFDINRQLVMENASAGQTYVSLTSGSATVRDHRGNTGWSDTTTDHRSSSTSGWGGYGRGGIRHFPSPVSHGNGEGGVTITQSGSRGNDVVGTW
jgi:hypothetical protein